MQSDSDADLLILGAGLAGLGAGIQAQRMGLKSLIIEESARPGGLCQNTTILGCDFDYGPKILLLDGSDNGKDLLNFLGDNYEELPVVERVYLSEYGLLGFPLQRHLVDLPDGERTTILKDIEHARAQDLLARRQCTDI
jgi:phytoene dehydrogenase-like protein